MRWLISVTLNPQRVFNASATCASAGTSGMATDEHHSQAVVRDLGFADTRRVGGEACRSMKRTISASFSRKTFWRRTTSSARLREARMIQAAGIFRDAVKRPGLHRAGERFLDDVFGEL